MMWVQAGYDDQVVNSDHIIVVYIRGTSDGPFELYIVLDDGSDLRLREWPLYSTKETAKAARDAFVAGHAPIADSPPTVQ